MQIQLSTKHIFFIFICFISISCENTQVDKIEFRNIGNYKVKGKYSSKGIIDGKAELYDSSNNLINVSNYYRGLKNGVSIDYNVDGSILDSVTFVHGKEYGYKKYIDSSGKVNYKNYFYFGLPYGPEIFYQRGKITKYLFNDFNKETLVVCKYDSLEALDSINFFQMKFIVEDKVRGKKKLKNLFGYLPIIPRTEQTFSIGISNKVNGDKKLFNISSNTFFLDTLLSYPPPGWSYFMSCSVKSKGNDLNKYFIEIFSEEK